MKKMVTFTKYTQEHVSMANEQGYLFICWKIINIAFKLELTIQTGKSESLTSLKEMIRQFLVKLLKYDGHS